MKIFFVVSHDAAASGCFFFFFVLFFFFFFVLNIFRQKIAHPLSAFFPRPPVYRRVVNILRLIGYCGPIESNPS